VGNAEQIEALEREILTAAEAAEDRVAGEVGGSVGGAIGGGAAGAGGGRLGGGRGAPRGARLFVRMRGLDRGEASIEVDAAPDRVLGAARGLFGEHGRKLVEEELPPLDPLEVWGLMHGGAAGLRPVVVRVAASARGRGSTAIVRTTAVEGLLIKQRPAQKVAPAFRDELAAALEASA